MTTEFKDANSITRKTTEFTVGSEGDELDFKSSFISTQEIKNIFNEGNESETAKPKSKNSFAACHRLWIITFVWQSFIIPVVFFCLSCLRTLFSLSNMIDLVLESCSRYIGISGYHWLNVKFIRQLFIIALLVLVFVHSRKDENVAFNSSTRLFPTYSLVSDYFKGELSLLERQIEDSEISVVMFYAPWDRESQEFAHHFISAAQYHHEQVTFLAINCWHPRGECRRKYKIYEFPLIVVYVKKVRSHYLLIPYPGPLSSHYLVRFIRNVIHPYHYIANEEEFFDVLVRYQAVVVGHFITSNACTSNARSFYYASIHKLQKEYLFDVKYVLITNSRLAQLLGLGGECDLQLRTKDKIVVFPHNALKNMKNITNFVDKNVPQLMQWLHISTNKKSELLSYALQKGPTLLVFAPDNPYHNSNELFELMKVLSFEYNECNVDSSLLWKQSRSYQSLKRDLSKWRDECRLYMEKSYESILNSQQRSNNGGQGNSFHNICSVPDFSNLPRLHMISSFSWGQMLEFIESTWFGMPKSDQCLVENQILWYNNTNFSRKFECLKRNGCLLDDMIERLLDEKQKDSCKRLSLGELFSPPLFVEEGDAVVPIGGLGCNKNRTLQFIAVDSLLHKDLADQYGVKFVDSTLTGSVIIDTMNEVSYGLNEPLTRSSLTSFIYNFTFNLLDRNIRKSSYESGAVKTDKSNPHMSFIEELDTETYLNSTSIPGQAYLVLHYTRQCGACSSIGDALLTVKGVLSDLSDLKFARIDVSKNTLPWHLTFVSVPTLIIYPHYKKSDTKVFNSSLPLNAKNLMSFIFKYGLNKLEQDTLKLKLCNNSKCRKDLSAQSLLDKVKYYMKIHSLQTKLKIYEVKIYSSLVDEYKRVVFKHMISNIYFKISNIKDKLRDIDKILHWYKTN